MMQCQLAGCKDGYLSAGLACPSEAIFNNCKLDEYHAIILDKICGESQLEHYFLKALCFFNISVSHLKIQASSY